MKEMIIIGAGGMGRTLYDLAQESIGHRTVFQIKGFIDDNINALEGFCNYPPVIGRIYDYVPKSDDIFVCSIGGNARRDCMKAIELKKVSFSYDGKRDLGLHQNRRTHG